MRVGKSMFFNVKPVQLYSNRPRQILAFYVEKKKKKSILQMTSLDQSGIKKNKI